MKKVCSASDATKTISFINANSGTLTAINEFMSTLSTQEFEKFTAMQRNGDFSDILKFVKEKADVSEEITDNLFELHSRPLRKNRKLP